MDQDSKVFISEFSVLCVVQNGKLRVRKPQSLIKMPQRKTQRFSPLEFLVLGKVQNGKLGVENLGNVFSKVSGNSEFLTSPSYIGEQVPFFLC